MKMFQHQQHNQLSQRHLRQTGPLVQLTHQLLLRENRDKLNKSLTMHFCNGCQELLIKTVRNCIYYTAECNAKTLNRKMQLFLPRLFALWVNYIPGSLSFILYKTRMQSKTQPEKTAGISRRLHWFPHEMTSKKRVQKFHTDDASVPRSGWCFRLASGEFASTNQNHYTNLGSDT